MSETGITNGDIIEALGVDIDSMLISQPDTGEQALDIADALVRSGALSVIVIDSVAAWFRLPKAMGDIRLGQGCGKTVFC